MPPATATHSGPGQLVTPRQPPDRCGICQGHRFSRFATPYTVPLWRCRDCGARSVHPVPGEADLGDRYEAEYRTGKWQELFDRIPPARATDRANALSRISGFPGRILDIGFGDGRFLDAALAAGWETWGLEVSETAARTASSSHRVVVGELTAVADAPLFDAVTFWDVLEHVPNPGQTVREAAGTLRPGGVMAASMPNVRGTESMAFGSRWRYYDLDAYGHLFHLGPDHLSTLFQAAGLDTVSVQTPGSVDLRDLLADAGDHLWARAARASLDRISGVVARVAVPLKRGNTLVVMARKPEDTIG